MPALSAMPAAEQYAELLARADALAASEASQKTEAIELYSSALALIPADNALQLPVFAARRQECEAGRAACLKALGDHAAAVRAAAAAAASAPRRSASAVGTPRTVTAGCGLHAVPLYTFHPPAGASWGRVPSATLFVVHAQPEALRASSCTVRPTNHRPSTARNSHRFGSARCR